MKKGAFWRPYLYMLNFNRLKKDTEKIKEFLELSETRFCDLTVGVRYLWRDAFKVDYAIYSDTLIMKETCRDYSNAFYFPIGKDVPSALSEIENYCVVSHTPLIFCCLTEEQLAFLENRYDFTERYYLRDWSDYIYPKEQFISYSGKKLSGQRNHVNKFRKSYPDYSFKVMEKDDISDVISFYNSLGGDFKHAVWSEKEERAKLKDYVKNALSLGQVGGLLKVGNETVGFSIGEVVKDTLYCHVEKANLVFSGVYPTLASEFVKAFGKDVLFCNREEDCGDSGLRISKLQYHPSEIANKYILKVFTLFDKIDKDLNLSTERLTITPIKKKDAEIYAKLYLDDELNKYWGYDYREDLSGTPDKNYFFEFQKRLKKNREEFSFAVRLSGKMIGELVLYNFDHFGGAEIGFRFFPEYQKNGYAFESATALKNYVFSALGAKTLRSRCLKENMSSYKLIEKLGFKFKKEDETHYYFEI